MGSVLVIPAVVVVSAMALLWLRMRRLSRPVGREVDSESPLSPSELLRLDRWQRRLRRAALTIVVAYLALAGAALLGVEGSPGRSVIGLWLLALLCLLGAAVQFSERCPRCGFNLGFQSRWSLPEECERCGVPYRWARGRRP